MKLDPQHYGLPSRTLLERFEDGTIALVIRRKSRIIMADGRKIVEKVAAIHNQAPGSRVVLKTTAPVCSKTKDFLRDEGIDLCLIKESGIP